MHIRPSNEPNSMFVLPSPDRSGGGMKQHLVSVKKATKVSGTSLPIRKNLGNVRCLELDLIRTHRLLTA